MTTRYQVILSEDALVDLEELAVRIAEDRGRLIADRYCARLESFCQSLCIFPNRGHRLTDIAPDQRVIGFERRVSIHFHIDADKVIIDRLLYAGRQS